MAGRRRPIEGFMVELPSGVIFEVKGLLHPPGRVLAYPRYLPDSAGDRVREGRRYRKVASWRERQALLREEPLSRYVAYDPVLGDAFCFLPLAELAAIYDPVAKLAELRRKAGGLARPGRVALKMAEELVEKAGLSWSDVGVSGSLLVGLSGGASDIDLVFYGRDACLKAYRALREMREDGLARPLGAEELSAILAARSADTLYDPEVFAAREPGKLLQGTFEGVLYSIRLVPARGPEPYGRVRFRALGTAEIRAVVADASEAIFTPCRYRLREVELLSGAQEPEALVSFRLRFCEHAREGEEIAARGKLEEAIGPGGRRELRLVVGGCPGDYFTPLRA